MKITKGTPTNRTKTNYKRKPQSCKGEQAGKGQIDLKSFYHFDHI